MKKMNFGIANGKDREVLDVYFAHVALYDKYLIATAKYKHSVPDPDLGIERTDLIHYKIFLKKKDFMAIDLHKYLESAESNMPYFVQLNCVFNFVGNLV